ncbi:MAG: hypothetical protein ACK5MT_05060 [Actinomycetales bacterium]
MKKNRTFATGLLAAAALVASAFSGAAAQAAEDTKGPALFAPSPARFVVGSRIMRGVWYDDAGENGGEFTNEIKARITWSAQDRSGICGYDVYTVFAGMEPTLEVEGTMETSYVTTETDYDDDFGGGSFKVTGWDIVAHDCAGNTSTVYVAGAPWMVQQDGGIKGWPSPGPTYHGDWSTVRSVRYSMGSAARSTTNGDSADYTVEPRWDVDTPRVALVMAKGPNNGVVQVAINGQVRADVDTYSPTERPRVVVWQTTAKAGDVITLINRGTPDRSQIDLDGFLLR